MESNVMKMSDALYRKAMYHEHRMEHFAKRNHLRKAAVEEADEANKVWGEVYTLAKAEAPQNRLERLNHDTFCSYGKIQYLISKRKYAEGMKELRKLKSQGKKYK